MNFTLALKMVVIGVVTGVILIALAMVNGTINDRQKYRDDAVKSIEASYAGPQTVIGPVLVRPYTQTTVTMDDGEKGTKKRVEHVTAMTATSFPHVLDVRGNLTPTERRHGLYKVTVYEFAGHLKGSMEIVQPQTTGTVVWGEPYLAMSVDDVRGIVGTPKVVVNGTPETMFQGAESTMAWQPNLRVPLRGVKELDGHLDFTINMNLAGTEQLSVAPVGDSNHVELTSTWPSPLFAGQFLPRTREVSGNGFSAIWDVSSLATGTQVQMQSKQEKPIDLMNVSLLTSIDPYKLSDRATKYGILFVVLTFGGLFDTLWGREGVSVTPQHHFDAPAHSRASSSQSHVPRGLSLRRLQHIFSWVSAQIEHRTPEAKRLVRLADLLPMLPQQHERPGTSLGTLRNLGRQRLLHRPVHPPIVLLLAPIPHPHQHA